MEITSNKYWYLRYHTVNKILIQKWVLKPLHCGHVKGGLEKRSTRRIHNIQVYKLFELNCLSHNDQTNNILYSKVCAPTTSSRKFDWVNFERKLNEMSMCFKIPHSFQDGRNKSYSNDKLKPFSRFPVSLFQPYLKTEMHHLTKFIQINDFPGHANLREM